MTSQFDLNIYRKDLQTIESWYIKLYGLKDVSPPKDEQDLFDKIVVLRKNEEYLEQEEGIEDAEDNNNFSGR